MEKEIIRKTIWEKERDIRSLGKKQKVLKRKLEDNRSIFNREGVMEEIITWGRMFRSKLEGEIKKKRDKVGLDLEKEELRKRVKEIGDVKLNEEEKRRDFYHRKNVRIGNKEWKMEDVLLDIEEMLFRENRDEEERERIRRKMIPIIEEARRKENRRDYLTEKEKKGMKEIIRRKYI